MISLHVLENLIQMITVRIRNKNLPEMVTGNQFHNSLNPLSIQLIEISSKRSKGSVLELVRCRKVN